MSIEAYVIAFGITLGMTFYASHQNEDWNKNAKMHFIIILISSLLWFIFWPVVLGYGLARLVIGNGAKQP